MELQTDDIGLSNI